MFSGASAEAPRWAIIWVVRGIIGAPDSVTADKATTKPMTTARWHLSHDRTFPLEKADRSVPSRPIALSFTLAQFNLGNEHCTTDMIPVVEYRAKAVNHLGRALTDFAE